MIKYPLRDWSLGLVMIVMGLTCLAWEGIESLDLWTKGQFVSCVPWVLVPPMVMLCVYAIVVGFYIILTRNR